MPTGYVNQPYVDTAHPSLDLNTVFGSDITGDSLYNYNSLSFNNCNGNTFVLTQTGILTGNPISSTTTCTISFKVSSKATGTQKSATSLPITIMQDVLWNTNQLWTGKGHSVPRYMDNAAGGFKWSEIIFGNTDSNNDYVKSQTGKLVSLTLTANQSASISGTTYRSANSFSLDGTTNNLDSVGPACQGYF